MTEPAPEYAAVRDLIGRLREFPLLPSRAALLLIDLQYLDASSDGEQAVRARRDGTWDEIAPYFARVEEVVVPAATRLIAASRAVGTPVMFTRCVSFTPDARDNGRRFREFGIMVGPDERDAQLLADLDARPGDLVWNKTTASVFLSTGIDRTLRQMGVDTLLVGGVVTSGCVESAVRDACDLDYGVMLVADACADRTPELHRQALKRLQRNFAIVRSTDAVVAELTAKAAEQRREP
jgi:ureidoacrylate peracid hydrolase